MIKDNRNYKKILLLLATFFISILIVDAYSESKTSFDNQNNAYTPFKNELKDTVKYLITKEDLPFSCSIISNKLFCEDTTEYGYMAPINKDEYLIIGEKSYLTAILDYWTLTSKDTTNGYVIKKSGINVQNKETQTGVRASVFVKPNIKFTGEGTITNPFKFNENVDDTPPTIPTSEVRLTNSTGTIRGNSDTSYSGVTLWWGNFSSTDDISGVKHYEYSLECTGSTTGILNASYTYETTVDYSFCIRAVDNNGNFSEWSSPTYIRVDMEAPIIAVKTAGSITLPAAANNVILSTYFNYSQNGGLQISGSSCVDTSNNNVIVANTSSLSTGTHVIRCTVSKANGKSATADKTIIIEGPIITAVDKGSHIKVPGSSLAWRIAYIEGGIVHLVTVGAPLYVQNGCTCVPNYYWQYASAPTAISSMNSTAQSYLVSTYATAIKAVDHTSFTKMASYNCSLTVPLPYFYIDGGGYYSQTGTNLTSVSCAKKDVFAITTSYYVATASSSEYQSGIVMYGYSSGTSTYGVSATSYGAGYSNEINGYYRLDMTLKAGVKITSGAGTAANPYIIGI